MKIKLRTLFSDLITGEWGVEDTQGDGVNIIRTTNFRKNGYINFDNIEKRRITKKKQLGDMVESVIDENKIAQKKLLDGDIIIEKSGGGIGSPVGRVVYFINPNNDTYLCNNFTQTLRVNKDKANPKYIFYYLMYLYNKRTVLKYQNQTTGLFNLKLEKYLNEDIDLHTFDLQASIISQLDTIQSLIDKRIQSLDVLDKLQQSIFFEMFGDVVNNQKKFKVRKLKDIVKKNKIITSGIREAGDNIEYGVPYIRSGDIKESRIRHEQLLCTSKEIALKHDRSKCETGDIVITIRASIGECAVVPDYLDGVNLTQGTARISPDMNTVSILYLYQALSSPAFKFLLNKYIKGATFREISITKLREVEIPIPDLLLQKEFSNVLESIINQKNHLNNSLNILQTLFQAILQYSFKKDTKIDESPIFKDLIERLSLDDLKGNKRRLQYLIDLFKNNQFDDEKSYSSAKEKLFDLIVEKEIEQVFNDDHIELRVK